MDKDIFDAKNTGGSAVNSNLANRVIYFDYLRVAATIAVIFLHTAAINWYGADVNGGTWKVFNFYDSLVQWSVPIFVMISGALFLGRNDIRIKDIYSKYVLRMLTGYCAWSFLYYLLSGKSIEAKILGLVSRGKLENWVSLSGGYYHLWFVPMIAGLYICLPILKQIVKNEQVTKYFLLISFIFWSLIPELVKLSNDFIGGSFAVVVNAMNDALSKTDFKLLMSFAFYFVLGYVVSNLSFSKRQRVVIYALGIAGFLFTIFVSMAISLKLQKPVGDYYSYPNVNVVFESMAVFVFFKNRKFDKEKINIICQKLSKWSFGAYFVHALVIQKLADHGISTISILNPILAVPVITLITFVISMSVSALLNQIPVLKKYIV